MADWINTESQLAKMQPADVLYLVVVVFLTNYFLQWFIPFARKNAKPS